MATAQGFKKLTFRVLTLRQMEIIEELWVVCDLDAKKWSYAVGGNMVT